MKVTIKEIAKAAGVSHTTVSRALNNKSVINQKTKEKIQGLAAEMGYIPNLGAKSLVTNKTYNIGLFFSSFYRGITPSFFYEVVQEVYSKTRYRYNIVVSGILEYYNNSANVVIQNFDGIIIIGQANIDEQFIELCKRNNKPFVLVNRKEEDSNSFYCDEKTAIYKVTKQFCEMQIKKIGIISGKADTFTATNRIEGYLNALTKYGLTPHIYEGDYSIESGYKAIMNLGKSDLPKAIICSNDAMAIGAYRALNEMNIKIGKEIFIFGFDDANYSKYLAPSLSTIERPIIEIVNEALEHLLDCMETGTTEIIQKNFKCKIINRESSRELN